MPVPFVDLEPQNRLVRDRVLAGVAEIYDRGDFTNGDAVAAFEKAFGKRHGGRCVAVGSGLDALRLSLQAAGISSSSRVIAPAMTFAATWEAIVQTGARVVPVDVDLNGSLSRDGVTEAIDRTKRQGDWIGCIVPVHLYGRFAGSRFADGYPEVADSCQAHGIPLSGWASAFSFYPTKNLGGIGDGGAIVFDFAAIDEEKLRALREHGQTAKGTHRWPGWTSRLDTIQAVVLLEKIRYLDEWNKQRAEAATVYDRELAGIDGLRLPPLEGKNAWHLYPVLTADRDGLAGHLAARGIGTGVHYPGANHLQQAFPLGYQRGAFPNAERIAQETLSLPLFPGITEAQQEEVCVAVRAYFDRGSLRMPAARPAPAQRAGTASTPRIDPTATVHPTANVYGDCEIGAETKVGAFVEIQAGAQIWARCKIGSGSFVCAGVTIEDEVFVGHNVTFCNDRNPAATNPDGTMKGDGDWDLEPTLVREGASIGSGATILPGVTIGYRARVAAGAVVTRSVRDHALVLGNPAREPTS